MAGITAAILAVSREKYIVAFLYFCREINIIDVGWEGREYLKNMDEVLHHLPLHIVKLKLSQLQTLICGHQIHWLAILQYEA
jgi:hypothetical protein